MRFVLPSVFAGLAAAIEAPKQSRPRAATTAASVNALTGRESVFMRVIS